VTEITLHGYLVLYCIVLYCNVGWIPRSGRVWAGLCFPVQLGSVA